MGHGSVAAVLAGSQRFWLQGMMAAPLVAAGPGFVFLWYTHSLNLQCIFSCLVLVRRPPTGGGGLRGHLKNRF